MPERKTSLIRVDSESIQGKDSFVLIRRLTVAEGRIIAEQWRNKTTDEMDDKQWDDSLATIARHIMDWNWVDDDGKPLPKPKDDPSALNLLTDTELTFIINSLGGKTADELKN